MLAAATTIDDLTLWSALVGIALPPLVAIIQHQKFPQIVNLALFGAACFFAAAVTEWLRNGSDWGAVGYFHTFLVILTAAIALYKLMWKPAGVIDTLQSKP